MSEDNIKKLKEFLNSAKINFATSETEEYLVLIGNQEHHGVLAKISTIEAVNLFKSWFYDSPSLKLAARLAINLLEEEDEE